MRLSDLLGTAITDRAGERVGWVTDVRLTRSGPVLGTFGAAYAIEGFLISPIRRGGFFGYERARVNRPALLGWLFGRLHRDSCFAPWSVVDRIDDDAIVLAVDRNELSAAPPLE